jgi:hypothetical protein
MFFESLKHEAPRSWISARFRDKLGEKAGWAGAQGCFHCSLGIDVFATSYSISTTFAVLFYSSTLSLRKVIQNKVCLMDF